MHVGPKNAFCPELYVDKWKVKKVNETRCFSTDMLDLEDGEHSIQESQSERYLGDIVSNSLSNQKNIASRRSKGIAASKQIISIINDGCFGSYSVEVFATLRDSFLVNSMLANSSVWYGVNNS